ncbi:F-box protein HRT3 [Spathaspora sp. JA1]|nr:F-box protein HRT3 [Spathaspora sp. JA1]
MSNIQEGSTLSSTDHEAIDLFEKGVEKESIGSMSDAVEFYRRAFKINQQVDSLYRQYKLPTLIKSIQLERGKNSGFRLDETKVRLINVDNLLTQFKQLDIIDASPLYYLPNDIWINILEYLVDLNVESWFKMSITCKKFAHLGFSTSSIWRTLCFKVYPNQIYQSEPVKQAEDEQVEEPEQRQSTYKLSQDDILKLYAKHNKSWKQTLIHNPFVKFLGCYISIINYYSEGGRKEFSSTNLWTNPIRIITYYRYLRFYPNGDVIKVLTILPPNQVVPHLSRTNDHIPTTTIDATTVGAPTAAPKHQDKKHKIYHGKWSMSKTGRIHIIIEKGSVPYYTFHYQFQIDTLGNINKHGKLNWIDYYAIRKPVNELDEDDRIGELTPFTIRNEKSFKFSRVRSYTLDN